MLFLLSFCLDSKRKQKTKKNTHMPMKYLIQDPIIIRTLFSPRTIREWNILPESFKKHC